MPLQPVENGQAAAPHMSHRLMSTRWRTSMAEKHLGCDRRENEWTKVMTMTEMRSRRSASRLRSLKLRLATIASRRWSAVWTGFSVQPGVQRAGGARRNLFPSIGYDGSLTGLQPGGWRFDPARLQLTES